MLIALHRNSFGTARNTLDVVLVVVLVTFSSNQQVFAEQTIYAEKPTVTLELSYEDEDEKRRDPFLDRDQDTTTIRERLEIKTRGWIYHPALAIYSIGIKPEWKQQSINSNTDFNRSDKNTFFGYFLDTTFFQYKPYTLKLHSSQDKNEFNSSLSPDNITESDNNRATLLVKNQTLPTTFTFEQRDTTFKNFFDTSQATDTFRIESRNNTARSNTYFRAEVAEQQNQTDDFVYTIDNTLVHINNTFKITDKKRLFSSYRFFDTSSEVTDSKTQTLSESLYLQHTPTFSSDYELRLNKREEPDFDSDIHYGSAGLKHQLYENLTTRFEVNANLDDFTGGEINTYESNLDFRYKRRIPAGLLNLHNGYQYRVEDSGVDVVFAEVRDASIVLTGTSLSFLNNINIDTNSIVVTNLAQNVIYVEGIDYVVTVSGISTAIARTLLGGIADGQQVLVDYRFVPEAPNKISRFTTRYGGSVYLWDALKLYLNITQAKENLVSGSPPSVLIDDKITIVGGEFKWRWSTTFYETEDRDTALTPLNRWRAQEVLTFQLNRYLSYGFSADRSETDLKDTDETTKSRGLGANLKWQIAPAGTLDINAFYRDTEGASQDTTSEGIIARLVWRYGAWRSTLRYEMLDESDKTTQQIRDRNIIFLQFKRTFR